MRNNSDLLENEREIQILIWVSYAYLERRSEELNRSGEGVKTADGRHLQLGVARRVRVAGRN